MFQLQSLRDYYSNQLLIMLTNHSHQDQVD